MRGLCVAGLGLLALAGSAWAGDVSVGLPTKAPPPAAPVAYDWTGYYLGAHLGYALGGSNWSAMQAGAPGLSGSLDFSNAYNFSTGNGSYLLGFQTGYDAVSASRWLLGVAADISFPSFVGGNTTFSSPPTGTANYLERVEFSGDARVRLGYAPGHWLYYVTGGFALELRSIHPHPTRRFSGRRQRGARHGGEPLYGAARRRCRRRRRRSRAGRALDRAVRIPVHRLCQSQRQLSRGRATVQFRPDA